MCFSCNSFLVYHSVLTNYTVSCLASCPPCFFSLLTLVFPPSLLRPRWALIGLLGIKPGAWERRGTFGSKMARGTVVTYLHGVLLLALWKPSLQGGGSSFLHPAVQHLWNKSCLGFVAGKAQSLTADCIFCRIFGFESLTWSGDGIYLWRKLACLLQIVESKLQIFIY